MQHRGTISRALDSCARGPIVRPKKWTVGPGGPTDLEPVIIIMDEMMIRWSYY